MAHPRREEAVSDGSPLGVSTIDSPSITGAHGHLYVAHVSATRGVGSITVSSVTGLGLTWTLIKEQCNGVGVSQDVMSVWYAIGAATTGAVTATLSATSQEVQIYVTRWSGVDTTDPIAAAVGYNTNGLSGACSGGVASDDAQGSITVEGINSVVVLASVQDDMTAFTMTSGWTTETAYSGQSVQSIIIEYIAPAQGALALGSANNLSTTDQWALVAIEIRAEWQPATAAYADVARIVWRDTSHGKTVVDQWISCSVQHDKHIGTAQLVTSLDATWAAAKIDPAADLIGSWVTIYYRDMTTPLFHGALVKAEYGYAYGTRAAALTFESMFGHIWRRCIAVTPNNAQFIFTSPAIEADVFGQRVMHDALGDLAAADGLWSSAVGGGLTVDRGDAGQFGVWTVTVPALHSPALSANDVLVDQQSGGNTLDLLIDIAERGDIAYTTTETGTPGTLEFDSTATFARTDVSATVVLSDQHGTLSGFKRTVDYTTVRNTWQIKGDGDGSSQVNTWYQDGSASTIGRFEDTVTFPAITSTASKEAYRDRMFALYAEALQSIEVEIVEQGGVLFNDTFGLRDTVRVHSALFGYAATHTVVGYKLDLPSTGVGRVSLTLNQHPRRMATDTRDWAEGPGGRGGGGLARLKSG